MTVIGESQTGCVKVPTARMFGDVMPRRGDECTVEFHHLAVDLRLVSRCKNVTYFEYAADFYEEHEFVVGEEFVR